ncbi:hypothetical protein, partial [Endozoicomonas acroporae]|uniref:hypothetical protein n=1 Tax=Endozoicomonas acroporae TaxID=1701104 RepID=UPI003D792266
MWKHIFKSGRNEGRLLSPEIFENDIGYIDGRSQFIVIDGYSFQEKYHSKTGEKIRSHAVVDGSYFIHTRHETGEIIYRYVNCEIEQVIECNMHYCWVQSDDCVLCYEDPTADQNNDTEDFNRCYDLNTGKNLWERVIRTDFYAQKDSETGIFFMNEEGNKLYRLNPATGETLWDIDLPEGVKTANEPIRVYDNVIAISLEKTVKQRGGRDLRLCFMWGLNP